VDDEQLGKGTKNETMNKKESGGNMNREWIGLVENAYWTGTRSQTQGRISGEIKNGKNKKKLDIQMELNRGRESVIYNVLSGFEMIRSTIQ
jgi:hypothetical protein